MKKWQKWRDDALYQYLWRSFEFELSHANEVEMEERSQTVLELDILCQMLICRIFNQYSYIARIERHGMYTIMIKKSKIA